MVDDWDHKSGATKMGMEDTFMGPVAGWIEDKCKTGLQSQMVYIDGEGKGENFTKQTVTVDGSAKTTYNYALDNVEPLNRFRIYVETLSGPNGGDEDDAVFGQMDRVSVIFRQMNVNYIVNMTLKVLSESEEPEVLLDDPDAFAEAIFNDPTFDMNLVYSVVLSRTIVTGPDGKGELDIDIPDTWNRGLIFVSIMYGYDYQSERDNLSKALEAQNALALEIVLLLVGVIIMMIPGINALVGPAYFLFLGALIAAEIAYFAYMDIASTSPAGNNRYDCSFPLIDLEDITGVEGEIAVGFSHNYVIQFGPEVVPELPAPDIDPDWLKQMEENQKIKKRNALLWIGGIFSAFIMSIIAVSSMGGEEDG